MITLVFSKIGFFAKFLMGQKISQIIQHSSAQNPI